jgi:hypothetical protein
MLKELLKKSQFTLSQSIKIYVPSTSDVNKTVDNSQYVEKVQSKLSVLFGGSTTTNGIGTWVSEQVGLVKESVKIVQSFTDEKSLNKNIDEIILICEELKTDMKQEGISLEIQGEFYVI